MFGTSKRSQLAEWWYPFDRQKLFHGHISHCFPRRIMKHTVDRNTHPKRREIGTVDEGCTDSNPIIPPEHFGLPSGVDAVHGGCERQHVAEGNHHYRVVQ